MAATCTLHPYIGVPTAKNEDWLRRDHVCLPQNGLWPPRAPKAPMK